MYHRSHVPKQDQSGFTIVELTVSLTLAAIVSTIFFMGFNTSLNQYLYLQKAGTQFSELATSSQRVATVLRGTTDFIALGDNDVTVYAYFYPNNTYVSQIRYYLNAQNDALLADVTPMSANPPNGIPVTANKKTYTVISNYHKVPGINIFTYLDASGNALSLPVSDQHVVKGMKVVLAVPGSESSSDTGQTMTLSVSLRNRKTNL